jgi:hypothetical protein
MHNIVSATFEHGGVVVGTARDVHWENCQQVCNAQQRHSCCSPNQLFLLQQLQAQLPLGLGAI